MKIGYARVSTAEQSIDLQMHALRQAGCECIHADQGFSGANAVRPGLAKVMSQLGPGDQLVVWKLDRLGRSLRDLVGLVDALGTRNVQFASLSECIDTSTAGGTLIFHLMGAMAQFERSLISERTRAGMAAASRRGRHPGRPKALTPAQLRDLLYCREQRHETLRSLAKRFGVHPRTVGRYLEMARQLRIEETK